MTAASRTSPAPSDGQAASAAPALPVPWRTLGLLFLGSRVLIYLFAAVSLRWLPRASDFLPPRTIADWFLRWDALWYFDVAEHGYHFVRAGDPTNVGYLPLYPWLLRAVSLGGLLDYRYAGYLVSLLGLWLATVWLWQLVARETRDARTATVSVVFLLFGPVTFFFSTLYSESWFLPLTIGALAAARERRWWLAGACGALAAFTRFVGIAILVPLLVEAVVAARAERRRIPPLTVLVACGLPVAGALAYGAVMWHLFDNPFMYFQAQQHWGRHFTWFWDLFARRSFTELPGFFQAWFAGTTVIAFLLLLTGVVLRMPLSFTTYVLTFAFIYISARFADSLPRYFSALFPFYLVVALLARRWRASFAPMLAISIALLAMSVFLFVNGYWFT